MSSDELQFVNLYQRPDVQRESTPLFHYKNEAKTGISLPARFGIIGASGSRKSLWGCNAVLHMGCFHTLYIIAKHIGEPLYAWLVNNRTKLGFKQIFATDDLQMFDQLWAEADQSPLVPKMALFDDLLTVSAKLPNSVLEVFNRGRKSGWSAMFISSSWFAIDPRVRNCIDIKVLKRVNDEDTVARILHGSGLTTRDAVRLYKFVVSDPDRAFIIDDANSNPAMRFRCNYTPIAMEDLAEKQLALKGVKARRQTKADLVAERAAARRKPQLLIEEIAE